MKKLLKMCDGDLSKIPSYKKKLHKSTMIVCSYSVDDTGRSVLNPIPEHQRIVAMDGQSLEIANLMYGTQQDDLRQMDMFDAMDKAERVTSACVRRFGKLQKQRDELEKLYSTKTDEE